MKDYLLLLSALLPIIIILIGLYFISKNRPKKSIKLAIVAFVLGALSVLPIWNLYNFLNRLLDYVDYSSVHYFVFSFIYGGIPEETIKWIVLFSLLWKSQHFNEKFDGIFYAIYVSLGFAMVENVDYVVVYYSDFSIALHRALAEVPAHATIAVAMGYYFSFAKFSTHHRKLFFVISLIVPIFLHGLYDLIKNITPPYIEETYWLRMFLRVAFYVLNGFLWIQAIQKIRKLTIRKFI